MSALGLSCQFNLSFNLYFNQLNQFFFVATMFERVLNRSNSPTQNNSIVLVLRCTNQCNAIRGIDVRTQSVENVGFWVFYPCPSHDAHVRTLTTQELALRSELIYRLPLPPFVVSLYVLTRPWCMRCMALWISFLQCDINCYLTGGNAEVEGSGG